MRSEFNVRFYIKTNPLLSSVHHYVGECKYVLAQHNGLVIGISRTTVWRNRLIFNKHS